MCLPFFLKKVLTITKSILFAKSTTIDPSLFLVPAQYLPIISSSPMFPLPTCPFRSASRTILSCFDILSINPSRPCYKSFFSSMLLLTCGAYALTMFRIDPFTSSFMAISLSDNLFTSKTLSTSSSLTTIPIPFFLPSAPL